MLSVSNTDGPVFNTRSHTQPCLTSDTSTAHPSITTEVSEVPDTTPKFLTSDRLEALVQMQKTDPSARESLNVYQIGKHLNMKETFLPMSEVYYTNMSQIQVRNFLL